MAGPEEPAPRSVPVRLGDRSYDVVVGRRLIGGLGARCRAIFGKPGRAFLIADDALPTHLTSLAADALRGAGYRLEFATITAREDLKSLATVERLVTHMGAARLERGQPVVALGGGIVGDVGAFAASIYRRGVPVVQCPTTLLAMVDASVGGKCGVNLEIPGAGGFLHLRKNMLGTFHQPVLVLCDVGTLDSLADDELSCGLAECLKHSLLGETWGDTGLLEWTRANAPALRARRPEALIELVMRNVAIKAQVVAGDEREERADGRGRIALNMGHTLGHAIETLDCRAVYRDGTKSDRVGLKHGEAVAIGLIAEALCGERAGLTEPGTSGLLGEVITELGLPVRAADLPGGDVIRDAMLDDKKVGGAKVRLAIPTGRGGCEVLVSPVPGTIAEAIEAIRADD